MYNKGTRRLWNHAENCAGPTVRALWWDGQCQAWVEEAQIQAPAREVTLRQSLIELGWGEKCGEETLAPAPRRTGGMEAPQNCNPVSLLKGARAFNALSKNSVDHCEKLPCRTTLRSGSSATFTIKISKPTAVRGRSKRKPPYKKLVRLSPQIKSCWLCISCVDPAKER